MNRVLILGASGMLGSAMLREFLHFQGKVIATKRLGTKLQVDPKIEVREFDAETDDFSKLASDFGPEDFIINCIGIVKARIDEANPDSVTSAIKINATFPREIQKFVASSKTKVIQIATDCVFSGQKGNYLETDPHDAQDVYGKTKSSGEVNSEQFMNIRVSIIGPELSGHTSLFDWVRLQPHGARINGYTNHVWNGIPALHFARISKAIIEKHFFTPGTIHLTPADSITKHDLVSLIASHLRRDDLEIVPFRTKVGVNRVLNSERPDISKALWANIGHLQTPSISQLIAEI